MFSLVMTESCQCDALGNVLLGNFESWHSCEYYFDPDHLPKHYCRPGTPLLLKSAAYQLPPFSRIIHSDTLQNSWLQIPKLSVWLSICGMYQTTRSRLVTYWLFYSSFKENNLAIILVLVLLSVLCILKNVLQSLGIRIIRIWSSFFASPAPSY